MHPFSQPKFESLPRTQQHHHCAQLLRQIYEAASEGEVSQKTLQQYSQLREWMGLTPWQTFDLKLMADEYHNHLSQAQRQHREHNLLPHIHVGDSDQPASLPLPIAIYLENLRSAHNVGSIIRTVEAFSLGTLYFSEKTPTPNQKQVQDTAMGAQDWVSYKTVDALDTLPRPLIALETAPEAIPFHTFTFPEVFTLAIGNEEYGCSDTLLQAADSIVTIPMSGRKNSLNVANAFAIAAAEIRQQYDTRSAD